MSRCRCDRRFGECRAVASAIRIRLAVMPDNGGTSTGALRHLTPDQMQGRAYQPHCSHDHIKALMWPWPRVLQCSERRAFKHRTIHMSAQRARAARSSRTNSGTMPAALPTDAHWIIAREALRLCRNGVNAWMRLSLVCKEWAAGAHCQRCPTQICPASR